MPMEPGRVLEDTGIGTPLQFAGVPVAGTNEVNTLTIGGTPTGGTFVLRYAGIITAPIAWNATNATLLASINAALDAHPAIGTGGMVATAGTLTAGIGTILITAAASLQRLALTGTLSVEINSLTGTTPTLALAKTTPGVSATYRGAPRGSLVSDITNGKLYQNTGTAQAPTWTVVGTQT